MRFPVRRPREPSAVGLLRRGEAVTFRTSRPSEDAPYDLSALAISRLIRDGETSGQVLKLTGAKLSGDLDLSHCEWRGKLVLKDCWVEGHLDLSHSSIAGRLVLDGSFIGGVDASYATIDGAFLMRRSECRDGFWGLGLRVSGALNLSNAVITAPSNFKNRCAVELFRAKIGDAFMAGAVLQGGLYANGCTFERNLRLQTQTVRSRKSMHLATGTDTSRGVAISLVGATIGGGFYLSRRDEDPGTLQVDGIIALTRLTCRTFHGRLNDLDGLTVELEGFEYGALAMMEPREMLALLDRSAEIPRVAYATLAGYSSKLGLWSFSRRVNIELHDRTKRTRPWSSPDRWRAAFWSASVRYGYQPWRALGWLALVVLISTALLLVAGGFFIQVPVGETKSVRGVSSLDEALPLALDHLLPFAGLNASKDWRAAPANTGQVIAIITFVILKAAAWGMAALGLVSVTGLARRQR